MDFVDDIKHGAIFIYPTDTIYGLGCDATNCASVSFIRKIKYRDVKMSGFNILNMPKTSRFLDVDKPLSIIAPSIDWIKEYCFVDDKLLKKYLPGPFTLILKKKDPSFMNWISSNDSFGIRIPDCEFTKLVSRANVPFVTTSVNFVGEPFATKIGDIPKDILDKVDIIIGVGNLDGRPSTIVVDGKEIKR